MAIADKKGETGSESITWIIITLCASCCLVLVVAGCTWSWWKRWYNRCWRGDPPPVPDATWEHGPTFQQLDASTLGTSQRDSITIEPLPNLSALHLDPRESFELRNTKGPSGMVPSADEAAIHAHDWFHHPFESFPRKDLEYLKVIGKSWFGRVIEAEATNIVPNINKKKVIVKLMRDDANDQEEMRFLNQCRIYRDSNNGNILKLLGFAVDTAPYIAIFEYWPLGDLKTYLIGKEKCGDAPTILNQGLIVRMALDIVNGLEWLIEAGFVHEDLATRNCLVASAAGRIVIGDYGLSIQKFPRDYYKKSNYAIPIRWAAPETVAFSGNSFQPLKITSMSNIWSFGIILWELYQFGKMPYGNMNDEEVISKVIVNKSYLLEPPDFPYLQASSKDQLYKLMMSCWNSVPEYRPTIQQIREILSTP